VDGLGAPLSRLIEGAIYKFLNELYDTNCILQTVLLYSSKAPLESQAQGTSLFTNAVLNQKGFV